MLPPCSHLAIKRGVFYFRRKLPMPHRGEIALSLRTKNFREAQHLATLAGSAFHLFFRSPPMSEVAAILRAHLAQALETDRQQHLNTPHGRPVYTTSCPDDHESPVDRDMEVVGDLLSDAREALATRDTRRVADLVVEYEKQHALPKHSLAELALGLLKVNVQVLEAAERRLVSGAAADIVLDAQRPPTNDTAANVRSVATTPLLSKFVADYVDLMGGDEWTKQTKAQNCATYRMFIEHAGDLPVGSYDRTHTGAFYELLRKLPAMYGKAAQWKGMTPAQIVAATCEDESIERLTMKTMKRHFSALGGLFDHARERGVYASGNPAHDFRFPSKRKASAARMMWSGHKLKDLFASPLFTGCASSRRRHVPGSEIVRDERYWLPILALYHGTRLEELAQLHRSDVRRENDIWFLDINDEGVKQIKNEQSRRRVPLHPEVERLGFLQYVEATAERSDALVFPQLTPGGADNKYGHAFSKWWTRYRKDIGLYEKGLDYHSFRHGVTTKLTEAGVSPPIIDQLTGHAGTGVTQTVYTKDLSLSVLYEAICKVSWSEVSL
jgi:integrase